MRITKAEAKNVASKLLETKVNKFKSMKEQLTLEIKNAALSIVPKEVLVVYNKYPQYFMGNSKYLYVNGEGIGYIKNVPLNKRDNYVIVQDPAIQSKLIRLRDEISEKGDELESLRYDVETALYSLKTYKRISEEFPQAIPFLPSKENNELALNIKDIILKLDEK